MQIIQKSVLIHVFVTFVVTFPSSPLMRSCFFSPFADHPRTPTAGSGGEFGKSCNVSIRAVSYVLKIPALII